MSRRFSVGCVILVAASLAACGSSGTGGSGGSGGSGSSSGQSCANAKALQEQILAQRDADAASGFFGPGPQAQPEQVAPCALSRDKINPNPSAPPLTPEDYLSRANPSRFDEYAAACNKYLEQAQSCNSAPPP